jgi:hypothetical protein
MLLCIEIVVLCGYKKQFDSINLWGKFVDGVDSFDWSGKKKKVLKRMTTLLQQW